MQSLWWRARALTLVVGLAATACGPDTAQIYDLRVENRATEAAVVVPTNDDIQEVAPGDDFYMVAPGGTWWAGSGVVYARPAAVFIFDSDCNLRRRITIPPNSPGQYLLVIAPDWSVTLERAPDELSTRPPAAPDKAVPCET